MFFHIIMMGYFVFGIFVGSFKVVQALREPQFKSNTTKIDALLCIFFWPVLVWNEACFNGPSFKQSKRKDLKNARRK